jgi:hypothetical protein
VEVWQALMLISFGFNGDLPKTQFGLSNFSLTFAVEFLPFIPKIIRKIHGKYW